MSSSSFDERLALARAASHRPAHHYRRRPDDRHHHRQRHEQFGIVCGCVAQHGIDRRRAAYSPPPRPGRRRRRRRETREHDQGIERRDGHAGRRQAIQRRRRVRYPQAVMHEPDGRRQRAAGRGRHMARSLMRSAIWLVRDAGLHREPRHSSAPLATVVEPTAPRGRARATEFFPTPWRKFPASRARRG